MQTPRSLIQSQVRQLFGAGDGAAEPELPHGDAGLFGPRSACWSVHGDFTSMMIGGVAALLLQMLHPAALAGVWDHSNFRADMAGRLRRTARFIAGTTYGSTDEALRLIERVRTVHDGVDGFMPDGTAYCANDPELLTWVHVAEVSCFLKAYLRHRDPIFSRVDQDRYFAETATIARRLGAIDIPTTRRQVEAYLLRMQPHLRSDGRTQEVAHVLLSEKPRNLAAAPFMALVFQSARDLLPDWAADMHGFNTPPRRQLATRLGAGAVGRMMRWALQDGAEARARRRVSALSVAGG
jgi:uncharacterized protein (DUF2236 family)